MFGIDDPPEVTPIRVVSSREENSDVLAACLEEQGFTVEITAEGFQVRLANGQGEAYFRADYVCSGQYPLHEGYMSPLTSEQLAVHYKWTTEHLVPCMVENGFDVESVPTWETYRAEFEATQRIWNPFDSRTDEAWLQTVREVQETCQIEPDDEDVYGTFPPTPADE